jgi:predicted dehydrogenase
MKLYQAAYPPKPDKESDPLRFGILGAANIAPMALILAVRSHPGADVVAVAARNEQKARTFAKKHGIKGIYYGPTGYQGL